MEFPKRKKNRLKGYNYSQNGAYFLTICAKNRLELFTTKHPPLELTDIGRTIEVAIRRISQTYPHVCVDKYIIMPDHVHIILVFNKQQFAGPPLQTLVGNMKRFVSMESGFSVWQKSFYEHIIRNEEDYLKILHYIETNPQK